MILTRTPLRISLLGGGSDHPSWYTKNGGLVVGGAIAKYVYVATRHLPPYHPFKTRVVYSETETVQRNADIRHPLVRACVEFAGMESGLEIVHTADLPGGSGTGSSSSFAVGLLNALSCLQGKPLLPHHLAAAAEHVERDLLGEVVGSQDQAWAAHGGLNAIRWGRDGSVTVSPLPLDADALEDLTARLALYYLGGRTAGKTSSEVSAGYVHTLATDARRQWAMTRMAEEGEAALLRGDWAALGRLLDRAWELKRGLAGMTTPDIDRAYAAGRMAGAAGGKLLGAGGGGCLLFVLPSPAGRAGLTQTMSALGLVEVPFRFDFSGSRVVYYDREGEPR